jgi:FtsP/CotA-like multicopper oxidase with cupredoxin domain
MNRKHGLKSLGILALASIVLMALSGSSFALEVYVMAEEFTYQDTNPANPYYSPILSGITMWGFAQCTDDTFATCDPASIPGPTLTANEGDTVNVHLRNSLPAPGTRGSAITNTSIVVPGQNPSLAPGTHPTWTDGTTGPRVNASQRVRSFTTETSVAGTGVYTWTNLKTGTYLYQSGTHPAVQVQMGLYGALIVYPGAAGQAYNDPSTTFDQEVVLLFSEIDPELHYSIQSGLYGTPPPDPPAAALRGQRTSAEDYHPQYFLINGSPYSPSLDPIPVGNPNERLLVRFLNAGLLEKTPTLQSYMTVIAEDGNLYPYPKEQYSFLLPAGKTTDAIFVLPAQAGYVPVFDRSLNLTNRAESPGGARVYLRVTAEDQFTLTVTKNGTGTGTVTAASLPGGIDCGSDCSQAYNSGTLVRLVGTPSPGSLLMGWSGGGVSTVFGDFIGTLTADTTVIATFSAFSSVSVLLPAKGEVIQAGSTFTIRWGSPANADTFRLRYSLNNGMTWTTLVSNVKGNTYSWSVPAPPKTKTNCLLKVIGFDANGARVGAGNSRKFTIAVP